MPEQQKQSSHTPRAQEPAAPTQTGAADFGDNSAMQERLAAASTPKAAFAAAADSPTSPLPFQTELQARFGASMSDLRAHLGQQGILQSLGAEAATDGKDLVFASSNPDKETVTEEVAHAMQARVGSGNGSGVSHPSDPAEREAKAVAAGQGDSVGLGMSAGVMRKEATHADASLAIDPGAYVCPTLSDSEDTILRSFALAAHSLMLPWKAQRTTGNLRFDTQGLDQLFTNLLQRWGKRPEAETGGSRDLYSDATASSQLKLLLNKDGFASHVAEIRATNPLKGLGGYATILGIPQSSVTHSYTIKVFVAGDAELSSDPSGLLSSNVEAGLYEIEYQNSMGMEWSQMAVGGKGYASFGVAAPGKSYNLTTSLGLETLNAATATSKLYYGPEFFSEAEFAFVSADIAGPAIGTSAGVMTFQNGGQSLTFDTSGKLMPIGTDAKGSASASMGAGKLLPVGQEEYIAVPGNTEKLARPTTNWVKLLQADFYFETGSAELRADSVGLLVRIGELAAVVGDSDPLIQFRAVISGSASPRWGENTEATIAEEKNSELAAKRADTISSSLTVELVETLQKEGLAEMNLSANVASDSPSNSNNATDRHVALLLEFRCGAPT